MRAPAILAAAALVLSGIALPTHAQGVKAPPKPSKEQLEKAALRLRVLISGLQSDKVDQPIKNALFSCIYFNSISKISEGMDKAIAANKQVKIDISNPTQLLSVMAGVCGYRPPAAAAKGK